MGIITKKGLTIVEMMIVIIMISVGMMGIISVIDAGVKFVNRTRQQIIAINLAREGMEGVYNIRDTNWLRRSGKKEACWLKEDPLTLANTVGCEEDTWIKAGNYILTGKQAISQQYFILTGVNNKTLNIVSRGKYDEDQDSPFAMCVGQDGFWYSCKGKSNNNTPEGRFYRMITIKGLYKKENNTPLTCSKGNDNNDCGTNIAKELRFCSVVEFLGNSIGKVEFCGLLTNFN